MGALRTLVSSLVDTLHLGSKSSKLVMFHVTFAFFHLGRVGWKIMKNQEASLLGHGSSLHYHLHCRSRIPFECGS